MKGFSDAAIFHRWKGLTWTFNEPEVAAILSDIEKSALHEFDELFHSLPWVPLEFHSFICDTPEEELSKLVPSASKLLQLLEKRRPGGTT